MPAKFWLVVGDSKLPLIFPDSDAEDEGSYREEFWLAGMIIFHIFPFASFPLPPKRKDEQVIEWYFT